MILGLMRRRVTSEKTLAHFCQVTFSLGAALVMVFGFRRFEILDLDSHQLFMEVIGVVTLAGLFLVLSLICLLWRRAV